MLPDQITLRPVTDADLPFLLQLYATTRVQELEQVPWTDEQKAGFIVHQFGAQHAWWTEHYPAATFDVVMRGAEPIGRLYVDRWEKEIRIVDILVAPEARGSGLGTALIEHVFEEADAAQKAVTIHVEQFNPARALYERLGFEHLGETAGVYLLMARPPATRGTGG